MISTYFFILSIFSIGQTWQQSLVYSQGYRSSCKIFQAGTFNLILSAPHGGTSTPNDVPDRTSGGCRRSKSSCTWFYNDPCVDGQRCPATVVQDYRSNEFAENVAEELSTKFNLKPYVIIGSWHRLKVDFNREINEATLNHPEAISAYQSYHNNIQMAVNKVKQLYGKGLLIDIHGQGVGNFTMVGYLLSAALLNRDDLQTTLNTVTSIESLCNGNRNECIRGPNSLGTILEAKGLGIAYPSAANPKPGNITFYEGGFITQNYISTVNAIQTELPYDMRAGQYRRTNAAKFAQAIFDYMKLNKLW